jgi:hypothetical protein
MNPYLQSLPKWRLLERWLGKSYASRPILKNRVQVTQKIEQPEPDPLPDGELPIEALDLPYHVLALFGR